MCHNIPVGFVRASAPPEKGLGWRSKRQRVFISYSKHDGAAYADAISKALVERGYEVWRRPPVRIETKSPKEIGKTLQSVKAVILIATEEASVSRNVRIEIETARKRSLPVIPINVGGSLEHGDWMDKPLMRLNWISEKADAYLPSPDTTASIASTLSDRLRAQRTKSLMVRSVSVAFVSIICAIAYAIYMRESRVLPLLISSLGGIALIQVIISLYLTALEIGHQNLVTLKLQSQFGHPLRQTVNAYDKDSIRRLLLQILEQNKGDLGNPE